MQATRRVACHRAGPLPVYVLHVQYSIVMTTVSQSRTTMSPVPEVPARAAYIAVFGTALIALAGCATTVSNPSPTVAVPDGWNSDIAMTVPADAPGDAWWRDFGIAELNSLVDSALRSNRDLRIANVRVAQAQAFVDGATADSRPQLSMSGGVQHGRQTSTDPKVDQEIFGSFHASWEVDVFGRNALSSLAAMRDAQGAELTQAAARVTIAAEVATAYFEAQSNLRRQALARDAVATLEREIAASRRRFEAGQLTSLETDRLVGDLHQRRADVVQLEGDYHVRMSQLAVLLGSSQPPSITPLASPETLDVRGPATLLPAELLERRPDVQRQARALEAAAARLGVAKRDLYPRIQLDWLGRKEWIKPSSVEVSPTIVIGYGLSFSLPILDGGRIRANIAVHESQAQEAMAEYEKAMLGALADAEIALRQLSTANADVLELEESERNGLVAARKSERLFEAGLTDIDSVLDARREHLRSQDALQQALAAKWVSAVAVRRAFAGGV